MQCEKEKARCRGRTAPLVMKAGKSNKRSGLAMAQCRLDTAILGTIDDAYMFSEPGDEAWSTLGTGLAISHKSASAWKMYVRGDNDETWKDAGIKVEVGESPVGGFSHAGSTCHNARNADMHSASRSY